MLENRKVYLCFTNYGCFLFGYISIQLAISTCLEIHHYSNILIHIQKDATLHSLFYSETSLYVSGGTPTHHQECK